MRTGVAVASCSLSLSFVDAARSVIGTNGTDPEKIPFECPEECIECCQDSNAAKLFHWLGGKADYFKCVLKDFESQAPAGRECDAPVQRKDYPQMKTHCKYLPNEAKPEQPCSDMFTCCCKVQPADQEDEAPEGVETQICADMPKDGSKTVFQNGYSYEMLNADDELDTYANHGPCKDQNHKAVSWHVDDIPDSAQRPPTKVEFHKSNSCCLTAKTHQVNHKWVATEGVEDVGGQYRPVKDFEKKSVKYKVCKSFEVLYTCSDDGGVTPNSKRVFTYTGYQGRCVGNKRSSNFDERTEICDLSCKCPSNCGVKA